MAKRKRPNPDHAHRDHSPREGNEVIEAQLELLLTPALQSQQGLYRQLGLRSRILNLSLMVAAVLTLLWRDVPSVRELSRMLAREDLLWCRATEVSQQALVQRFLSFPAVLFKGVFEELLPVLRQRWAERQHRPLPSSIRWASQYYEHIWVADCSTLEALFRKLKSLQALPKVSLAGKIATIIDGVTRLPVHIWFDDNPKTSDTAFEPQLLTAISAHTLLIVDRGFYHFEFLAHLVTAGADFITRLKAKASFTTQQIFTQTDSVKDRLIILGTKRKNAPQLTVRLIEVRFGNIWYSYITSVTEPRILPPFVVADLYRRRWRIEEAFNTVKRLLGLSFLWTGSLNGVKLQIWATWLFYAVLVDLGDAIADELGLPLSASHWKCSIEDSITSMWPTKTDSPLIRCTILRHSKIKTLTSSRCYANPHCHWIYPLSPNLT